MIYRSNLTCPDLTPHFKHLFCTVGPFGHDVPHDWADKGNDPDFDVYRLVCGLWTHDEAAILWNIARRVGGSWMDIGAHTGWTSAHIATATLASVMPIDPMLDQLASKNFYLRFRENTKMLGDFAMWNAGLTSQDIFGPSIGRWFEKGFCIDGDHSRPIPLQDAQGAHQHLSENGVIVFHDFIGTPVQEAVAWLIQQGYKYRIYTTPQMVACCWRGDFQPPEHVPDPAIAAAQPFDWNKEEWWK